MYAIAFFGFLMMLLSVLMIANPENWSNGIVKFSKKAYFHSFEILSRLGFGVVFIVFADQTQYPTVMLVIGYLLIAVGTGLLLTPPSRHRQFAIWSAHKFRNRFRPAGLGSLLFGAFLIYAAVQGSASA